LDFRRTEVALQAGDSVVLYTDGVNEAFNPQRECYGNDRLLADLQNSTATAAPGRVASVLKDVHAFVDGAPQSDDIAVLVLRLTGAATS